MGKTFSVILFIIIQSTLSAQSLLKINHADILRQDPYLGKIIFGNVDIEYDVYRVKCDSAVINKDNNSARLFKNIQFSDTARTIKCGNATLSKTPNGRIAYLTGSVKIKEKDFLITGKDASLNEISDKVSVTDSVVVKYFEYPSILYCSGLEMDTERNIISSQDVDSVLCLDSLRHYRLYTRRFRYEIDKKFLVIDTKFYIKAYEYEKASPEDQTIDPEEIEKRTKDKIIIKKGNFTALGGRFYFGPFSFEALGNCCFDMTETDRPDTLRFSSDKISYSETDNFGTAEGRVNISKGGMNISSGLAKYYGNDRTARFYTDPLVTYEKHKVTGDSMKVISSEKEVSPESAVIYGRPYYESEPDSLNPEIKNFLTGKLMELWFSDDEINKIIVSKEAEGVYFISREKNSSPDASNYLLGDEIELFFSEGDVKNASIKGGCEGIYFPEELKMDALKKKKK